MRLLEKALGGYLQFPLAYAGRRLINATLEVLRANEEAISHIVPGFKGGSGLLALQQFYNEIPNPYKVNRQGGDKEDRETKKARKRFEAWRRDILRALEESEKEGSCWLSLKGEPKALEPRPDKLRRHANIVCAAAFSHPVTDSNGSEFRAPGNGRRGPHDPFVEG